jgi:hypothetical protein
MNCTRFVVAALLLIVPSAARGQSGTKSQAASKETVVLDISVIEADADATAELRRGGSDRKRLDDLFATGKASLIADLELQGSYNRTVTAQIGRRVPIQTASLPSATLPSAARADARSGEPAAFGFGIPQIQYEDTGIKVRAAIGSLVNGKISVGLELRLNDVGSQSSTLTPVFISKDVSGTVTVGEGELVPVLSITERSGAEPTEPRAARTAGRPPLRFMVLLMVRPVD